MWKPNDVVAEHKTRATVVWIGLLLSVVGFVVWQTLLLVEKYKNPSTTFIVSDEVYPFPYMEVCFGGGNGCDRDEPETNCINTVTATVIDACEDPWDVQVPSAPESEACVTFNLESVGCNSTGRPYIRLQMFWLASNDTGGEDNFNSRVSVFLGGVESQELTWVPYNRIVFSEEERASRIRMGLTDMTIGKSVRTYISGQSITSYPTLTISTTDYHSRNQSTFLSAMAMSKSSFFRGTAKSGPRRGKGRSYGFLLLTLTLGSFSLTELSDDNPVNMLDFVANIGGFWEILLLAWGVCFVATHETAPRQKARMFSIAVKNGKNPVVLKRSKSLSTIGSDRTCSVGVQLDKWQAADRSIADHEGGVTEQDNPWHATGVTNGGDETVINNQLDISQATDSTFGIHRGNIDNQLDISQPSSIGYGGGGFSANETNV